MNKSAIQKFAVWARRELINGVTLRARRYGITAENTGNDADKIINGQVLTNAEMTQRKGLIQAIKERGFQSVMDEAAYTWFNRFIALRYMEVNDYLTSHIRVFTNSVGEFKPELLKSALDVDLPGLDMQQVMRFIERNENENLYRTLLLAQCNAMNELLPYLFEPMEGWTALLLPDNILQENSVIGRMVSDIPEEDWKEQVQIVGWLYQYYNTEPKADVFAGLKKNIKINKDTIPAATQLFTPDWIVRYMVENSLGRLWVEHLQAHEDEGTIYFVDTEDKNDSLLINGHRITKAVQQAKKKWKYYLDEAEQEPDVEAQLQELRKERLNLKPEEIKLIDPCMGSGHILVYAFDVFMQIYLQVGWTERDAAQSILKNNLYGIDIDKRAAQLAYFAVMMKARQHDRRILTRGITPNLCTIVESNGLTTFEVPKDQPNFSEQAVLTANYLIQSFTNARELGSIINVAPYNYDFLLDELKSWNSNNNDLLVNVWYEQVKSVLPALARQARFLSQKYDIVITNPPYMSSAGMGQYLSNYIKDNYPDSKSDLFAVFIEKCMDLCVQNGFQSMITQHVWMFLASYQCLREKIQRINTINMVHLGARAFDEIGGEIVQTTSFVFRNNLVNRYKGTYCRLVKPTSELGKEDLFLSGENRFFIQQEFFTKIPSYPVAYWIAPQVFKIMESTKLENFFVSAGRFKSCNDELFLRYWWEPTFHSVNWHPYCKGGDGRKFVGNEIRLLNWTYKSQEFYKRNGGIGNKQYWDTEGITWATITTSTPSFRIKRKDFFWSSSAPTIFSKTNLSLRSVLALLNSKPVEYLLEIFNPTASLTIADVLKLPYRIEWETQECIDLSTMIEKDCRIDWDSFETSCNFSEHPMVRWSQGLWDVTATMCTIHSSFGRDITVNSPIEASWWLWNAECDDRFKRIKANEEELNRFFINLYGLQDELTPDVADADVTVYRADLKRDIKSLISYAVGCMFGRYSLDKKGLIFAGGNFDDTFSRKKEYLSMDFQNPFEQTSENYICLKTEDSVREITFSPDKDNILPICDDEYFEDDIVGRFVKWVEIVFGAEKLEANLQFIANALGGPGTSREIIRHYFLNDFFKDHCSTYSDTGSGKRPIYWLFDAGKKNSFKALIYMHRYEPNLISKLRTDYVHVQQQRLEIRIAQTDEALSNETRPAVRKQLNDQMKFLREQETELRKFEEKIHHLADQHIAIDLDDGVKVNHSKFGDVLAPIK